MHELGIAESILDAVRKEVGLRPGARVRELGLRVGSLSGVDPDALDFCFGAMVRGTELEPLVLEIERTPRRQRCPACDRRFEVLDLDTCCPGCGAAETEFLSGDELEIAYLEVEEVTECGAPRPAKRR